MNYILNEQGEVKVRSANGIAKFIQKHLAEDKQLMKTMHFEVVEAPLKLADLKTEEPTQEQTKVAEGVPAKRGPKQKQ